MRALERHGRSLEGTGDTPDELASEQPVLASWGGVNVHAKVAFDGRDRLCLERLCRYLARPPLAQERLSLHPDGRVRLAFKAPWKDGSRPPI